VVSVVAVLSLAADAGGGGGGASGSAAARLHGSTGKSIGAAGGAAAVPSSLPNNERKGCVEARAGALRAFLNPRNRGLRAGHAHGLVPRRGAGGGAQAPGGAAQISAMKTRATHARESIVNDNAWSGGSYGDV
jgi:hypothetical protein